MKPFITTYTGKKVNPLDIPVESIDIRDIAHALALVPRFAGHTQEPISIAQHSVHVSRLLDDTYFALQGLLHDGSEAYLGDITKWLKMTKEFSFYRQLEDELQMRIYDAFQCPVSCNKNYCYGTKTALEWADWIMVRYEAERFLPGHHFPPGYPAITEIERKLVEPFHVWDWETAEQVFLLRFDALAENRTRVA